MSLVEGILARLDKLEQDVHELKQERKAQELSKAQAKATETKTLKT